MHRKFGEIQGRLCETEAELAQKTADLAEMRARLAECHCAVIVTAEPTADVADQ